MDFRGGLKLWRYPTDPSVIQNDNDDTHVSDIDKRVSCAIYIYILSPSTTIIIILINYLKYSYSVKIV